MSKLKGAFLFHVRGDAARAARELAALFPREHAHALACTALALARDLLDDAPAGDPSKLKGAFLFHVRGDAARAARELAALFPREHAHALACTALALARDLLDDAPAGDPR
ncbi:unnamed protein product [Euphydryas editha]|uniref:Uncharacterized protein n=1 Tax=Euphydryas editha TaxID=104508 RepID=A0AAU9U3U3_EUPED|nr:unnamed protein product [Euphydryas editha]